MKPFVPVPRNAKQQRFAITKSDPIMKKDPTTKPRNLRSSHSDTQRHGQ